VSSEGRSQGGKCLESEGEQTTREQLLEVTLLALGNKSTVSYMQRLALGLLFSFVFFLQTFLQNFTGKLRRKLQGGAETIRRFKISATPTSL
jgi:hypothetical protein